MKKKAKKNPEQWVELTEECLSLAEAKELASYRLREKMKTKFKKNRKGFWVAYYPKSEHDYYLKSIGGHRARKEAMDLMEEIA